MRGLVMTPASAAAAAEAEAERVAQDLAATRAKVVSKFGDPLADETLARQLEICVFNWAVRTCTRDCIPRYWANKKFRFRYTTRALSILQNLKHPKNPALLKKVRAKEISVRDLAGMLPQTMFPELWAPVYERLAIKQLRRMAKVPTAFAGSTTCGRCKSKNVVFTELQTRSADEPMTVFYYCQGCNKNWKG